MDDCPDFVSTKSDAPALYCLGVPATNQIANTVVITTGRLNSTLWRENV